jgi:agmatine deiminase
MLLSFILLGASSVRVPAEWEAQQSVWLSWPRYDNVRDMPVAPVTAELAAKLSATVGVDVLVSDDRMGQDAASLIQRSGGNLDRVRMHVSTNNEIWIRDFGPIFMTVDGKTRVGTFRFNYWGYSTPQSKESKDEDAVDERVASMLGLPTRPSSLITEGGNHEFNGKGLMMAVWAVEAQRNPGKSKNQVASEFRRAFGVKKVVWLPFGVMEDDLTFRGPLPGGVYTCITTGGHVDNTARFVNENTVLLAEVTEKEASRSPIARESRRRLEADLKALQGMRDLNGKKLTIVRMPSPELNLREIGPGDGVYDFISALKYQTRFPKGKRVKAVAAASYMNFLITNGQVITSAFWKPGRSQLVRQKDELAQAILKRMFPTRTIVAIDVEAVNWGGGGIHCITQQQPKS